MGGSRRSRDTAKSTTISLGRFAAIWESSGGEVEAPRAVFPQATHLGTKSCQWSSSFRARNGWLPQRSPRDSERSVENGQIGVGNRVDARPYQARRQKRAHRRLGCGTKRPNCQRTGNKKSSQSTIERSAPFIPSIRENGRIGLEEPFSTKDLGGSARGGHVSVEQGRSRLVR